MSTQRRRRWVDVVQMLYKCFVFTGTAFEISLIAPITNIRIDCVVLKLLVE